MHDIETAQRKAFEAWISGPPFEREVTRNSMDESVSAWPGHYTDYPVQLAWEAWQAGVINAPMPHVTEAQRSANLTALEERGRQGLDLSPGDELLRWAHQEIVALTRWKSEALAVMNSWDCQAVGKLLDMTLGVEICANIEPKVRELIAQRDRARIIMEVALRRFSRWSLRNGEPHKPTRSGDYPPQVQAIMDKMRDFIEKNPAAENADAAAWFVPVIRELRALPIGALDAEFEMILARYYSHPGAQFPVEVRMALESIRDTAIAMKDSLVTLPPTGGSVLLVEAPERLRATACGALEKMRSV